MRAQAQLRIGPRRRCDTHRQAAPAAPPGNSPLLPTDAGFRPQPSPRVSPARACRRARRAEAVITGTVDVITPSEPSWIPPCVRPSRRQFGMPVLALRHESTDAARRGRPWSLPLEGRAAREPHPTARRGRNTTPRPPPTTSPLPDEGEGHTAALHARRDTKIIYGTALWCGRQRTHPAGAISLKVSSRAGHRSQRFRDGAGERRRPRRRDRAATTPAPHRQTPGALSGKSACS